MARRKPVIEGPIEVGDLIVVPKLSHQVDPREKLRVYKVYDYKGRPTIEAWHLDVKDVGYASRTFAAADCVIVEKAAEKRPPPKTTRASPKRVVRRKAARS